MRIMSPLLQSTFFYFQRTSTAPTLFNFIMNILSPSPEITMELFRQRFMKLTGSCHWDISILPSATFRCITNMFLQCRWTPRLVLPILLISLIWWFFPLRIMNLSLSNKDFALLKMNTSHDDVRRILQRASYCKN